eukprot:scaffold80580_cov105-Phaeocystis_antarctica.AAC.1
MPNSLLPGRKRVATCQAVGHAGAVQGHNAAGRLVQGAHEQQVCDCSPAAAGRGLLRPPRPEEVHRRALRRHQEARQGAVQRLERLVLRRRRATAPWQPLLPPSPPPLCRLHAYGLPLHSHELVGERARRAPAHEQGVLHAPPVRRAHAGGVQRAGLGGGGGGGRGRGRGGRQGYCLPMRQVWRALRPRTGTHA